jgi:dolichol-phosphate mannosyltransferase
MRPRNALYSVVLPVHNEAGNLRLLHERLTPVLQGLGDRYEMVFVDDGSSDGSLDVIRELATGDEHVRYVSFSRNFGHEAASTAGIDRAEGDAVVLMDADLQDPPEVVPELVEKWREGYDIVCGRRLSREGESAFKRATASVFYRLLNWLSDHPVPVDTGDFRLMDRTVVQSMRQCRERTRFIRGLVSWQSYKQTAVRYERPARHAGETKYNAWRLLKLSADAIAEFSIVPLRISAWLGLATTGATALVALGMLIAVAARRAPSGFAWLAVAVFFLGGVQMLLMGVLGEYVGKIYREVQARPIYVVREEKPMRDAGCEMGAESSP